MVKSILQDLKLENHPDAKCLKSYLESAFSFCHNFFEKDDKAIWQCFLQYAAHRIDEIEERSKLKRPFVSQTMQFGKLLAEGEIRMDILYFKGDNHVVTYRVAGSNMVVSNHANALSGTLTSLFKELERSGFVQVNYKFIVNKIHVVGMDSTGVFMDDFTYITWGREFYRKYKSLLKDKHRRGKIWNEEKKNFIECDF
jgi:hypothetical protein